MLPIARFFAAPQDIGAAEGKTCLQRRREAGEGIRFSRRNRGAVLQALAPEPLVRHTSRASRAFRTLWNIHEADIVD